MKEHVPDRQGIAFVALFILGNSIIYGLAWRAGRDLWLSFLVATGLSFPLILLYSRLHSLMHGQVFSEGMESLFGKWPSRSSPFSTVGMPGGLAAMLLAM